MRRVGFQMQVRKDQIEKYKEVHRNVWPELLAVLTKHGWHRYSLFMNESGLVFGYFETESDFATALAGFVSEEVTARWTEACGDLIEMPAGSEPKDILLELEEVFHLD